MEINNDYVTNPSSRANGKIDSKFTQNLPGDCALLASIFSMAQTEEGAKAIENSINIIEDANGNITKYEVTFDGPDETYTVTQNELEEAKKEGERQYSTGDDDVTVLELAMEKCFKESDDEKLKEILNNYPKLSDDVLNNVNPSSVTYLLADETLETAYVHSPNKESLTRSFIPQQNYTLKDINGNTITLKEGSLYRPTSIEGTGESANLVISYPNSDEKIRVNYDTFINQVFAKNSKSASQKTEKLLDNFEENPNTNVLIFGAPQDATVKGASGEDVTLTTDEAHAFIVSDVKDDNVTLLNSSNPTVQTTVSKDSLLELDNYWIYGTEKKDDTKAEVIQPKESYSVNTGKKLKRDSAVLYPNFLAFLKAKIFGLEE